MNAFLVILLFFFSSLAAVQTPEDVQRQAFFNALTSKSTQRPIPKALHVIWLGLAPFPESSKANVRKWQQMHPDWQMFYWTDVEESSPPVKGMQMRKVTEFSFSHLENVFSKADNFGERTKILAYEILFQEGGVAIDHGSTPHKALDPLNETASFYCGLEGEEASVLSSNVYPATHLIAAHPGHEILGIAMQWLETRWDELEEKHPGSSPLAIHSRAMHRTYWALSEGIECTAPSDARVLSAEELNSYATWHEPPPIDSEGEKLKSLLDKQKQNQILVCCLGVVGLIALVAFKRRTALILLLLCGSLQAEDFDALMGKETPHWSHLTKERDLKLLENCRQLFAEQHRVQAERLIPPVVHFIWLGPRPFPPESVENVRSWIALHPDWTFKFWTDRPRDPPCNGMQLLHVKEFPFQFLRAQYEESQNWGEKSDILRFEILYREGGVYVDHDAKCLKSFEPFHHTYDFYAGLETPHPSVMGRCLTAGNGLVASRAGHPTILRVLERMQARWEGLNHKYRGHDAFSKMQRVMERTYMPLTEAIEEGVPSPGTVFPCAYFFPKGGIHPIYSEHFFANAWAIDEIAQQKTDKNQKRLIAQLKKRTDLLYRISWGLLALNVLAVAGLFLYARRRII